MFSELKGVEISRNKTSEVDRMINVKTDEIYGANPVVSATDMRTHLVNIDSRFRQTMIEPATDFVYRFAHPYKNVIKARVASVEIPLSYYTFSASKKNTMFRIDAMDYVGARHFLQVTIPDGNYTAIQLVLAVQAEMDTIRVQYGIFCRISLNTVSNKVTITYDGSGPPPNPPGPSHEAVTFGLTFVMVGLEDRQCDFGLGAYLGFTKHTYGVDVKDGSASVTSESLISVEGDTYFLLAIDDMYTVEHKTKDSYFQALAKIVVKRKHATLFDDGILSNEIVFAKPVDLKQVRVRLLDAYGEVIDLQYNNMSLSLEIKELMNVQLYDAYRTQSWSSKEPQAGITSRSGPWKQEEPRQLKHINGSSASIAWPNKNFN